MEKKKETGFDVYYLLEKNWIYHTNIYPYEYIKLH